MVSIWEYSIVLIHNYVWLTNFSWRDKTERCSVCDNELPLCCDGQIQLGLPSLQDLPTIPGPHAAISHAKVAGLQNGFHQETRGQVKDAQKYHHHGLRVNQLGIPRRGCKLSPIVVLSIPTLSVLHTQVPQSIQVWWNVLLISWDKFAENVHRTLSKVLPSSALSGGS